MLRWPQLPATSVSRSTLDVSCHRSPRTNDHPHDEQPPHQDAFRMTRLRFAIAHFVNQDACFQARSLISKRVVPKHSTLSKLSTMQCLLAEALSPDAKAMPCTLVQTSPSVPRPITPPLDSDPHSEDESEPSAKFRKLKVDAEKESELVVALVAAQFEAQSLSLASMDETLRGYAANTDADAFYTVDLGVVLSRWEEWRTALPRLVPFYAVKCCNEPALLETLSRLGCSFDCASPAEMQLVMAHGATPERIIYAHAVKPPSHIAAARAMGVGLMTFDSTYELDKVKATHPSASMVLRIHAADPHARCQLGNKFGALPYELEGLLLHALKLNMHVRGVSFHIGSGATGTHAYTAAIEQARGVFDLAERLGLPPLTLLDIGGGFSKDTLRPAAAAITAALDAHFPVHSGVEVIAEPGRFFAESTHTLCCAVYGKRVRPVEEIGEDTDSHQYYLMDGVYGSFNCLLYDHATVEPRLLTPTMAADAPQHKSTLFGPTCDGIDQVAAACLLPELSPGDWLRFDNMGAYTRCAGSSFNGFNNATLPTYYLFCRDR